MKTRIFLFAILSVLLVACTSRIVQETVESYADGSAKAVRFYKEDGRNRTLIKEILYYPNHQKYMEGEYKDGKREGKWTSWNQNGNKWSEGNFKNGLDDGLRVIYHENGKKFIEGYYKDGIKTGVWRFYDDKGIFVKEENYNQ
jgi:antitoxin component YwqK of YwqJK toxin-antitoxin module